MVGTKQRKRFFALQHERSENKQITKLESDIKRLNDPTTSMNPHAREFVIKNINREINSLKRINKATR